MERPGNPSSGTIDRDAAVSLARSFLLAFNNVNMYGPEHPAARSGADDFYNKLKDLFAGAASLTFHLERGILICEGWRIEREVKNQRLVERLESAGINSISFLDAVEPGEVVELLRVLLDARTFKTLDLILEHMEEENAGNIRFNHFIYKKVSADEEPRAGDEVAGTGTGSPVESMARNIVRTLKTEDWTPAEMEAFFEGWEQNIKNTGAMLPQLKDFLFQNGLTQSEYLQFVHKLSQEMPEGEFGALVEGSGKEIGVSVNDVREEIKKSPAHIVSLVKMGVQFARLLEEDREPLIQLLFQYTENALRSRVLTRFTGKEDEARENLGRGIEEIKHQLYRQMLENEVPPEILRELDGLFKERLPVFIDTLRPRLLPDAASAAPAAPAAPASAAEEKTDRRQLYLLPTGVMHLKETKKSLEMEIERNSRYNTPFSCISISVAGEESAEPEPWEILPVFTAVTELLERSLRTLDFIGSLGSVKDNHLLVIMSMTDKEGSEIVLMRLLKEMNTIRVELDGQSVVPGLVLSAKTFDPDDTPDMRAFLRRFKAHHRKEMKRIHP
ncbi:MAG: hypothetical protein GY950_15345 [bacterium]|nr:hypothetical protein [bacterium]